MKTTASSAAGPLSRTRVRIPITVISRVRIDSRSVIGPPQYARLVDPLFEFALSVKALQRELERGSNELMKPLGLTGPQADALVVIGQAEPIALKDLGRLLIAEAGHPSRLVDRLVEAGLVERRAAAEDRRRVELKLTPAGRRLARRVEKAR